MRYALLILLLPLFTFTPAQDIVELNWEDHISYKNVSIITQTPEKVYAANDIGLFVFDKQDQTIERLNKIHGLSDVGITALEYLPNLDFVLIGYRSGSIDIIHENSITTISDVKNKLIPTSKAINKFYHHNGKIWVGTGYGISVIDQVSLEIDESFFIGVNNTFQHVKDFTILGDSVFVASESGVYCANVNNNLLDYNFWNLFTSIPPLSYNSILSINNTVYANFDGTNWDEDTTYVYQNGSWFKFASLAGNNTVRLEQKNDCFIATHPYYFQVYDKDGNLIRQINNWSGFPIEPNHVIFDGEDRFYVADKFDGLINVDTNMIGWKYFPNGPPSNDIHGMAIHNKTVWVAPGSREFSSWGNHWKHGVLHKFDNHSWSYIGKSQLPGMDSLRDILEVRVDPNNPDKIYAASWTRGLLEITNESTLQVYTPDNSAIQSRPEFLWYGIAGMDFDEDGNLWITNSFTNYPLIVKTPNGTWVEHELDGLSSIKKPISTVVANFKSDYRWLLLPKNGKILVHDNNQTLTDTTDDNVLELGHAIGFGNLPGANIYEIIEDNNGHIWIGTDQGVAYYDQPELVFTSAGIDAKVPVGSNGPILKNRTITTMDVDNYNRKWVGTLNGGVYVLSENGEQILHAFDKDNSPLFSNYIMEIKVDRESNRVYMGTDQGILSLSIHETNYSDEFNNVTVFPNPVHPNHKGTITIKGIVHEATVKITNIEGDLMFSTVATSNEVYWDGTDGNNQKVGSGVYLVFATNRFNTESVVAKILFIN